jgi:hypothetical protein
VSGEKARRSTEDVAPARPPRPVLVELATAILVIGGALGFVTSIEAMSRMADLGTLEISVASLSFFIGASSVVLGLLLRTGRAWLFGVNLIAIAGFLELISGTVVGLLYGALDVFVVLALVATRDWFRQPLTPPTASPPTR